MGSPHGAHATTQAIICDSQGLNAPAELAGAVLRIDAAYLVLSLPDGTRCLLSWGAVEAVNLW